MQLCWRSKSKADNFSTKGALSRLQAEDQGYFHFTVVSGQLQFLLANTMRFCRYLSDK